MNKESVSNDDAVKRSGNIILDRRVMLCRGVRRHIVDEDRLVVISYHVMQGRYRR